MAELQSKYDAGLEAGKTEEELGELSTQIQTLNGQISAMEEQLSAGQAQIDEAQAEITAKNQNWHRREPLWRAALVRSVTGLDRSKNRKLPFPGQRPS